MLDCNKLPNHLADICRGTYKRANGKLYSLKDRKIIISRYLRVNESEIEIEDTTDSKSNNLIFNSEIGTKLHVIIERETGGRIECSECRDEVTKLNLLTEDQVQAERESIAIGIVERGKKKAPRFWQRWGAKLAPSMAKQQVLSWINEACESTKKKEFPIDFVTEISVAVRIAKRKEPKWAETIQSVVNAGFTMPITFAEPDAGVEANIVWPEKMGAIKSFKAMCEKMIEESSEWLLLCEDDIVISDHTADYIRTLNVNSEVLSLYTTGPRQSSKKGWHKCGLSFIGSLAILIRRSILKKLMRTKAWRNWAKHDCVDKMIRAATSELHIDIMLPNPSLVQHTGNTPAIYENRKITDIRQAKDWTQCGEYKPKSVTLITPTGDRQDAFKLCERWIKQQSYTGDIQWIVVDDGKEPTEITFGQKYIRETPVNHHSLCRNVRSAIPFIENEYVLIIEDDDYYHPHYISTMVGRLQHADLVGEVGAKYYYIREKKFYHFVKEHIHSSLCRTGMTQSVVKTLTQCAQGRHPSIDLRLWEKWIGTKYTWKDEGELNPLCVGIKGVDGRKSKNWELSKKAKFDQNEDVLRRWIGKDNIFYTQKPIETVKKHDLTTFTCIFNNYDPLKNPTTPGGSKYVCITDKPTSDSTIKWECRQLKLPDKLSQSKAARYYKINSHLTGIESEWLFYIDGSMRLIVDPQHIIDDCLKLGDANLYLWQHHERSCIYAEAAAVGNGIKETRENANRAAKKYRQQGFPENAGLYLGGIIVRRGDCREFNEAWWHEVETESVRDQISLPVAIAISGIKMLSHPPMTWTQYMVRHAHRSKNEMKRDIINARRFGVNKKLQ